MRTYRSIHKNFIMGAITWKEYFWQVMEIRHQKRNKVVKINRTHHAMLKMCDYYEDLMRPMLEQIHA